MLLLMADYDDRPKTLSQSYRLIKKARLDEQLGDMLAWNDSKSFFFRATIHRRLRDVKVLRENPELAESK
jgi:hypothetical protein